MSDIKEIKPHDKPEEYVIEDYPTPPTSKNVPSAILFNWLIAEGKKIKSLKFDKNYLSSFTNGWTGDVQYGKFGNVVLVHGRLAGGTNGQVALILPDGYKPSLEVRQPTTSGNTLTIYQSGGCVISGPSSGGTYYFSLIYFT